MPEVGSQQRTSPLNIDKRHTYLEQLTPALQLRMLNQTLFIPFQHVMSFEMDFGGDTQKSAVLQVFDPSFIVLDSMFFNIAQLSLNKGVPLKMRWGYANVPLVSDFVNQIKIDGMQDRFLSEEFSFQVFSVDIQPQENGNMISLQLSPEAFDPILTKTLVPNTFISAAFLENRSSKSEEALNAIEKRVQELKGADRKTNDELRNLQDNIELIKKFRAKSAEEIDNIVASPNVVVVGSGNKKKLTFNRIYTNLMNIAEKASGSFQRENPWQKPLPMYPKGMDLGYDFIVFEGKNESVMQCLYRLGGMMVGVSTENSDRPVVYSATDKTASKPGAPTTPDPANNITPRYRMVGGKPEFYSARLSKNAQFKILNESDEEIQKPSISPDQTNFVLWEFKEAPFDYTFPPEPPIATYWYHGGNKDISDIDNMHEILEFSAQSDQISSYYSAANLFTMSGVRNKRTGLNLTKEQLESASPNSNKRPSQEEDKISSFNSRSDKKSSITDPNSDTGTSSNRSRVTADSNNQSRSSTKYEIPISGGGLKGEADAQLIEFTDRLRTKIATQTAFNAEMTIIGDPRLEPTLVSQNTFIRINYNDKSGRLNPIYSGDYRVHSIKHSIGQDGYKTMLSLNRFPKSDASEEEKTRRQRQITDREFKPGEPLDLAQVTVIVKTKGGAGTKPGWVVSDVIAFEGNVNKDRINKMLQGDSTNGTNIKTKLITFANNYLNSVFADFETIRKILTDKSTIIQNQQKPVDNRSLTVKTNFIIADVVTSKPSEKDNKTNGTPPTTGTSEETTDPAVTEALKDTENIITNLSF